MTSTPERASTQSVGAEIVGGDPWNEALEAAARAIEPGYDDLDDEPIPGDHVRSVSAARLRAMKRQSGALMQFSGSPNAPVAVYESDEPDGPWTLAPALVRKRYSKAVVPPGALARPEPTWTKEAPTRAGWYWMRTTYDREPQIVHVTIDEKGAGIFDHRGRYTFDFGGNEEWYSEPLPEPPQ